MPTMFFSDKNWNNNNKHVINWNCSSSLFECNDIFGFEFLIKKNCTKERQMQI